MKAAAVVPESHAAKALQSILDVYPRDELFQVDTPTLTDHAIGILRLQERQRVRLFLRRDPFCNGARNAALSPFKRMSIRATTNKSRSSATSDGHQIVMRVIFNNPIGRTWAQIILMCNIQNWDFNFGHVEIKH